jgi:hypothetical protein
MNFISRSFHAPWRFDNARPVAATIALRACRSATGIVSAGAMLVDDGGSLQTAG